MTASASNSLPRAAGEAAHTPGLVLSDSIGTAPEYDASGRTVLRYRSDFGELGGGDNFCCYGTTAAESEAKARRLIAKFDKGIRAVNAHAELVEALRRANERFAEISAQSEPGRSFWTPNQLRNYAKAGCAECCAALAKAQGGAS